MFGLKKKKTENVKETTDEEDTWRCLDNNGVYLGRVYGSDKEEAITNYVNSALGPSGFDRPVCKLVRKDIHVDVSNFVKFIKVDQNGPTIGSLNMDEEEVRKRFRLPSQSVKKEKKEISEDPSQKEQIEKQFEDMIVMGLNLINHGKYEMAIEGYDMVLEADPENIAALNNKGIALAGLGRYDEAVQYYYKALEIEPTNCHVLNCLSSAFFELGHFEKSRKYSDISLGIEPKNCIAINGKALALDKLGRYDDAIENFNKVLEIEPANLLTLMGKGRAMENQKKYDDAITCFDQALDIYPKNDEILINKKRVLEKKQKSINID